MTKGIITIATGDIHYYRIAANLLLSYRTFADAPLPFAIIAEEENEYTALFDKVIITEEAKRSFLDKFLLLKLCPFEENIFFDADSLAYGNLNEYWKLFEGATDFSALGQNFDLSDNNGAWYDLSGIGEYANTIKYKSRVHAGIMFIRRSNNVLKMYDDCIRLYESFDSLTFHSYPASVDECILGLAMPLNNMKAIEEKSDMIAAYPCLTKLKANLYKPQLEYSAPWHDYMNSGLLLHWVTNQTKQPLYKFNTSGLYYFNKHGHTLLGSLLFNCRLKLCLYNMGFWLKKAYNKIGI